MATPLAHSLAGYAISTLADGAPGQHRMSRSLLCVVIANAADLDFLPGALMGSPVLYHQGITHSLGFALLVSLGVAAIYWFRGKSFSPMFFFCGLAYLSHLLIDFLGRDGRSPYGIPLFWPFSEDYVISPVPVFWGVRHAGAMTDSTQKWLEALLHPYNLGAMVVEVAVLLPFVLLGQWRRRVAPGQQGCT
jgi:inner membrane protein